MGVDNDSNFVFEQGSGSSLNLLSSQMDSAQQSEKVEGAAVSLMTICKEVPSMAVPCSSANVAEQFLVADWDPVLSMDQNVNFNGSAGFSSYNAGVQESQWINSSNAAAMEKLLGLSCIGSGNFSEIMGSFALSGSNQIEGAFCSPEFPLSDEHGIVNNLKGKKRKRMPEYGAVHPHSPLVRIQDDEAEQKDASPETFKSSPSVKDGKKHNSELNSGVNSHKPAATHAKSSQHGDASKEDYIHVRAKRGLAISSHSLAERVRREKISERMKLLQDLVPGCNKITGKAAMLDEIINYVWSLQRQVEFLSMKLAAVDTTEMNLDIEQILSKDDLHSLYRGSAVLGYGPAMSHSLLHSHGSSPQGVTQAEMIISSIPNPGGMLRTISSSIFRRNDMIHADHVQSESIDI